MQTLTKDQLHYISKGKIHQKTLKLTIHDALFNNTFDENYIIESLPGLGKTYELKKALKTMTNPPLVFEGSSGIYGYTVDVATAIYVHKMKKIKTRLVIANDDCDTLFENTNVNTAKKMFDDSKVLRYGRNWTSLKPICTDLQFEALGSFADESRTGLDIDVSDVSFITLTNIHLPTIQQVEKEPQGSSKYAKATALYAIRRRSAHKEISMENMDLWGYCANVVLNEKICEKFMPNITQQYKDQILEFLHTWWEPRGGKMITEKNLSIVEKMTKDIVKYPNDYKDIWDQEYVR